MSSSLGHQSLNLRLKEQSEVTAFYVPVGCVFKFLLGEYEDIETGTYLDTLWDNPLNSTFSLELPIDPPYWQMVDKYILWIGDQLPGDPGREPTHPDRQLVGYINHETDPPAMPVWIAKVGTEPIWVNPEAPNWTVEGTLLNQIYAAPPTP